MPSHQPCIIQTETHDRPPTAWQLHSRAKLQEKADTLWKHPKKCKKPTPAATKLHSIKWALSLEQVVKTDLPRQLNHLQIPRAQTFISVDRPAGYLVTKTASVSVKWTMPQVKLYALPPQLKVLVHQLCQAAPVSALESCPEGRTVSVLPLEMLP